MKNMIISSEPYQRYKYYLTYVVPNLKEVSDNELQKVVNDFQNFGFKCDVSFFRKKANDIEQISNIALRKIMRNAMLVFKNVK